MITNWPQSNERAVQSYKKELMTWFGRSRVFPEEVAFGSRVGITRKKKKKEREKDACSKQQTSMKKSQVRESAASLRERRPCGWCTE